MTVLRSLAESATHRLIFKRRLPKRFGGARIFVSPEGGLRYLVKSLGDVDPTLLSIATELIRPGDVVWDIGANVGLFAFAAAGISGDRGAVLAVEPDTWLIQLLQRSAALSGRRAPVHVLSTAIADQCGVAEFFIARRNRSTSYLAGHGSTQTGGWRERQMVPVLTLDRLREQVPRIVRAPDLVKIDVEGAEVRVLRGAHQLLAAVRPTLVCEVASENADAVGNILHQHGYAIFDGESTSPSTAVAAPPYLTVARPVS